MAFLPPITPEDLLWFQEVLAAEEARMSGRSVQHIQKERIAHIKQTIATLTAQRIAEMSPLLLDEELDSRTYTEMLSVSHDSKHDYSSPEPLPLDWEEYCTWPCAAKEILAHEDDQCKPLYATSKRKVIRTKSPLR
jgi:hypothetical protein